MRLHVILFDLDGTLSDSAGGIVESLRHALARNGLPALDPLTERAILGPPLHVALPPLVGADRCADVLAAFRAHQAAHTRFKTRAFPGVVDVLTALAAAGVRLAIASSKPEPTVRQVAAFLGVAGYFETIVGDTPEGTRTKSDVIRVALDRLGDPDPADVVMIGDRSHDVVGARAHGIRCVGVRWGYALPDELETAGADPICASPDELAQVLGVAVDAAAS